MAIIATVEENSLQDGIGKGAGAALAAGIGAILKKINYKRGWYDISTSSLNIDNKIKYVFYPGKFEFLSSIKGISEKTLSDKDIKKYFMNNVSLLEKLMGACKERNPEFKDVSFKCSETKSFYREDGSIVCEKEKEAYSRIWYMTRLTGFEDQLVICKYNVIVFPNFFNDSSTVAWSSYGYKFIEGYFYDVILST